jgi:hypothetical protein
MALAAVLAAAVLGSSGQLAAAWAGIVAASSLALASIWIIRVFWVAADEGRDEEWRGDDPPPSDAPACPSSPPPPGHVLDWAELDRQRAGWEPTVQS